MGNSFIKYKPQRNITKNCNGGKMKITVFGWENSFKTYEGGGGGGGGESYLIISSTDDKQTRFCNQLFTEFLLQKKLSEHNSELNKTKFDHTQGLLLYLVLSNNKAIPQGWPFNRGSTLHEVQQFTNDLYTECLRKNAAPPPPPPNFG